MAAKAPIPAGWRITTTDDVSQISAGGTPLTKSPEFWGGNIPWMNSGDLNKRIIFDVEGRITKLGFESSSAKIVPKNSVLIGLAGQGKTRGTVAVNKIELTTNQSVAFFIPKKINYKYLFFDLYRRYDELRSMSAGDGGRGGLNLQILKNLKLLLPPLPEQQKIVEVLEAWDSYLEKLTYSIKLKKKIKKGLMEKLLTGKVFLNVDSTQNKKTRYFRIPKHWQIVSIGEVANEVSKKNTANINLPVLSCTKHAGLVDSLKFFKKQIFSKKLNTYKVVDMGQFAYATNHIEEGSIGLQNLYDSGLVSPMYTVFKTDKQKILNGYLFPLLKTVLFRHIFKAKTSSSVNRRGSLRWKSFSKIEIPLPPMEDQEKIANILTIADRDIEALEKKKMLVEQQKKFLLNNLITGRIRLPEFAETSKH